MNEAVTVEATVQTKQHLQGTGESANVGVTLMMDNGRGNVFMQMSRAEARELEFGDKVEVSIKKK